MMLNKHKSFLDIMSLGEKLRLMIKKTGRFMWRARKFVVVSASLIGTLILLEAPFAAGVIIAVKILGTWPAFFATLIVYCIFDYATTMWLLHVYEKKRSRDAKGFAQWLQKKTGGVEGKVARRLVQIGGGFGFVFSSLILGSILTILSLRHFHGVEKHLKLLTVISAIIFNLGFVALYAGIANWAWLGWLL